MRRAFGANAAKMTTRSRWFFGFCVALVSMWGCGGNATDGVPDAMVPPADAADARGAADSDGASSSRDASVDPIPTWDDASDSAADIASQEVSALDGRIDGDAQRDETVALPDVSVPGDAPTDGPGMLIDAGTLTDAQTTEAGTIFPFDIGPAAYSKFFDRIVFVSGPVLHLLDPESLLDATVPLPFSAAHLALSYDGKKALVAEGVASAPNRIAYIDLATLTVAKTCPTSRWIADLGLWPDGRAIVFPVDTDASDTYYVDIASCVEQHGNPFRPAHGLAAADGNTFFVASDLGPSIVTRFTLSDAGQRQQDLGTFDDVDFCNRVWQSADGARLFGACGSGYREDGTAIAGSATLVYTGTLEGFRDSSRIWDMVHTSSRHQIAVVVDNLSTLPSKQLDGSHLRVHDDVYLALKREVQLPTDPRFDYAYNHVFQNNAQTTYYVLGYSFSSSFSTSILVRIPTDLGPVDVDAGAPPPYLAGVAAPAGGNLLPFAPVDGEYDRATDHIVFASHIPTNALHVYEPETQDDVTVALPLAPTAVEVGPDGQHAAVGYDGWVTYVDLAQRSIVQSCPFPGTVSDMVVGSNGFIYVFPGGQDFRGYSLAIADCKLALGGLLMGGSKVEVLASGTRIYAAADTEIYEVPVTANGAITSRNMLLDDVNATTAGRVWPREIDATTTEFIVGGGGVYRDMNMMLDLTKVGQLAGIDYNDPLTALLRTASGKLLVIPKGEAVAIGDAGSSNGVIATYDATTYARLDTFTVPAFARNGVPLGARAQLLFERSAGGKQYVLVSSDVIPPSANDRAFGIISMNR
jgi:hypothetical protein